MCDKDFANASSRFVHKKSKHTVWCEIEGITSVCQNLSVYDSMYRWLDENDRIKVELWEKLPNRMYMDWRGCPVREIYSAVPQIHTPPPLYHSLYHSYTNAIHIHTSPPHYTTNTPLYQLDNTIQIRIPLCFIMCMYFEYLHCTLLPILYPLC